MKKEKLIYSLCCPFTKEVHYIGKSTSGMTRPLQHLRESHSEKIKEWVNELKCLNYKPEVKILQYVSLEENLDKIERYWVNYYLNKGNLLLNSNLILPLTITPNLEQILSDKSEGILHISNFIKQKRISVNLTQTQLAEYCGIALTVVRKIEQGKQNFNFKALADILNMFGVRLDVKKVNKQNNSKSI